MNSTFRHCCVTFCSTWRRDFSNASFSYRHLQSNDVQSVNIGTVREYWCKVCLWIDIQDVIKDCKNLLNKSSAYFKWHFKTHWQFFSSSGTELPLMAESYGLLNDIFPFPSILDAGYPIFNLHFANALFDVILPSVLGSSLWSFGQRIPFKYFLDCSGIWHSLYVTEPVIFLL